MTGLMMIFNSLVSGALLMVHLERAEIHGPTLVFFTVWTTANILVTARLLYLAYKR